MQLLKRIICIPGLGGHPSVFSEYVGFLPEYELLSVEFVNREKTLAALRTMISAEKDPVTLFCHCYSAQMGIQLAEEMPEKIDRLIFLEPFFQEFQPWMKILRPLTLVFLGIVRFFSWIGIRRRNFTYEPDYVALAKYPIYIQPFFDIRWQNLTDYLYKCYDILTYKLPTSVKTPVLMMFSPNGFSKNPVVHARLKEIFVEARVEKMDSGTHNVITMGAVPVASRVREYMKSTV